MSKIIFITGASKGFGKLWAEALLKQGNKVVATARNTDTLNDLVAKYGDKVLPLALDVNDRNSVFEAVDKAAKHFGKIDVLINNAGFGLFGTTEETTEAQARQQMETNFFGSLWVAQAILPVFRQQKSGHLIQISSLLGLTTLPLLGIYNASKFAVEGLIGTIAQEVAHLGIKTTLIEPNGYSTEWAGASATQTSSNIADYNPLREAFASSSSDPNFWGKPEATVQPLLDIVNNPTPPERILFGSVGYQIMKDVYNKRLQEIEEDKETSIAAQG
ncbi:MAG: short-chain dehydrogenase/reductase [Pseudopedobacter saltans]|uniref:Short-chain dehydrogenase/reductase n=1 Tax=Pseudopedobacter saltans TaxID=151895 RepID=A0A2W5ENQ0_9SPHI|nr:MAG: short-chain dehydrogenase/reductase [Pseudopedobacter saltans]